MPEAPFQVAAGIPPATPGDIDAITHFKTAIEQGHHWFISLLQAMSHWRLPEETVNGRYYRYVVGGEAFDWLLLAERLCEAVDGLIPLEEKEAFLFAAVTPINIVDEEMCRLMGESLYRAQLNFFYGVTVEEALHLAVEEEVLKEQRASVWRAASGHRADEEAFLRVYGQPRDKLLQDFRVGYGLPACASLSLAEMKEFLYWLFKYRLKRCDPARVASDTRKALQTLDRLRSRRHLRLPNQTGSAKGRPRRLIDLK